MTDVSIIIVSYNTVDILRSCLASLFSLDIAVDVEVIVVDNDSRDGSRRMVREEFPTVLLIANDENAGFARANNQGMAVAGGAFFLLLNSDTVFIEDCLSELIRFLRVNPAVGVAGCRVLNEDRSLQYSCYNRTGAITEYLFFAKGIIKDFWDPLTYRKYMKYDSHRNVREVDYLKGCFMLIRRSVIDAVGGLDENFHMYIEDFEFCERVKQATDFSIVYYPRTAIVHLERKSAKNSQFGTIANLYDSCRYFLKKCRGRRTERLFDWMCRTTWKAELLLFSHLPSRPKIRKKKELVESLLNGRQPERRSCRQD